MGDDCLICISGFPRSVTEAKIRQTFLNPLGLAVNELYLDKRCDGFSDPRGDSFTKCFLDIKSDIPIKKICAMIFKTPFESHAKLQVRPIALIPVSVKEEFAKTGSNVIGESEPLQCKNYEKRSFSENAERSRCYDSSTYRKLEDDTQKNQKSENSNFLCLSGLEPNSTEESVSQLLEGTNTNVKKIHLDLSTSDNGEDKLKVYIDVDISSGVGAKRFCAFLSRELTEKSGSKVTIKSVDYLPRSLYSGSNKRNGDDQYGFNENRKRSYDDCSKNKSYDELSSFSGGKRSTSNYNYHEGATDSETSGAVFQKDTEQCSKKETENSNFFCLTGLSPDSTEQSVTELLEEMKTTVRKVQVYSSAAPDDGEEKLKVYIDVDLSSGLGVKRFGAFLSRELTTKLGSKVAVKHLDAFPQFAKFGNNGKRENRERNDNEYQKRIYDDSWKLNDQGKFRGQDERNVGYGKRSKFEDFKQKQDYCNIKNYEHSKYSNESGPPSHIPIIYYDPENPKHKCHEIGYAESIEEKTPVPKSRKLKTNLDDVGTQALKKALMSGGSGFSFGFSTNQMTMKESGEQSDDDTQKTPVVQKQKERKRGTNFEAEKRDSEMKELEDDMPAKQTNTAFMSLFSFPQTFQLNSGFFKTESNSRKAVGKAALKEKQKKTVQRKETTGMKKKLGKTYQTKT